MIPVSYTHLDVYKRQVILTDENGKIVDALKRVDAEMSSQRLVLPGVAYQLPPPQEKLCLLNASNSEVVAAVKALPGDAALSKALLSVLQGVSPIVCREIEHRVGRGKDLAVRQMDEEQYFRLGYFCQKLKDTVERVDGSPYLAVNRQKKPLDFSFLEIQQYGTAVSYTHLDVYKRQLVSFVYNCGGGTLTESSGGEPEYGTARVLTNAVVPPSSFPVSGTVNINDSVVYQDTSAKSTKVGTINLGSSLSVLGVKTNVGNNKEVWYQVESGKVKGWARAGDIRLSGDRCV